MKLARLIADKGPFLLIGNSGGARLSKLVPLKDGLSLAMNVAAAMANFQRIAKGRDRFAFREICTISGQSSSAASNWIAKGLLRTCGKLDDGRERAFDFDEAFLAGLYGSLKRAGIREKRLFAVADLLRPLSPNARAEETPPQPLTEPMGVSIS